MMLIMLPLLFIAFLMMIAFQVFLSTRKNMWLGLILPIILLFTFFISILSGFIAVAYIVFIALICILMLIYIVCRLLIKNKNQNKNKSEIKKMNIQDLD